jgi:hypothetical protein
MPVFLPTLAIMRLSPTNRLSDKYLAALRVGVEQAPPVGLRAARKIGREVVAAGLETLDLARIHNQALSQLLLPDASSDTREDVTARAAAFFTEAITPIEETHRAAQQASADLTHLHKTLDERTSDLADASRDLLEQVAARAAEVSALEHSQRTTDELLKSSRDLEKQLRAITHEILSAAEVERHRMSLQLNDEIAQILLGIHIHILALKKDVADNHSDLTRKIAAAQHLVEDSANVISRLVHEFSIKHQR